MKERTKEVLLWTSLIACSCYYFYIMFLARASHKFNVIETLALIIAIISLTVKIIRKESR